MELLVRSRCLVRAAQLLGPDFADFFVTGRPDLLGRMPFEGSLVLPVLRIPWFRVHAVLLNDPGRLICVHCVHTALLAGWAGGMLLYELTLLDASDPVFNPAWRQGALVLPLAARLGLGARPDLLVSMGRLGHLTERTPSGFTESLLAHFALSGLMALAASWHWAFWDLDLFFGRPRVLGLSFGRVFAVHLALAGLPCFAFGSVHLASIGFWCGDSFGSFGAVRPLQAQYSFAAPLLNSGALVAHHSAAGLGLGLAGCWHAASFPGAGLFTALAAGNLESLLASSLCPFFVAALVVAATMWYGGSVAPADLYGPARFSWDSSYYAQEILFRASLFTWDGLPEALLLFDSIGVNPAKGGLFRAGPMIKGDGIVRAWAGHALFRSWLPALAVVSLSVRRMPLFFETFPVLLMDARGLVRGAIPFRRAESRYEPRADVSFAGG
jgi:photosystem II CP47 chlorophyll apoprotein